MPYSGYQKSEEIYKCHLQKNLRWHFKGSRNNINNNCLLGLWINSFLASGDICHLLITFANCLDPDQDRQNVSPDLDPNSLTL